MHMLRRSVRKLVCQGPMKKAMLSLPSDQLLRPQPLLWRSLARYYAFMQQLSHWMTRSLMLELPKAKLEYPDVL